MSGPRWKLFRFGPSGGEKTGIWMEDTGKAYDVSLSIPGYGETFFSGDGMSRLRADLPTLVAQAPLVELSQVRLGPPIERPSKLLGVGLNYRAHAAETGAKLPLDPKIFMKATSAICGVSDPLLLPPNSRQTDYEVELALVIGKLARHVSVDDALAHVAGYLMCNDYSERDWQKNRDGQFVKGKSYDGFAPLGPMLVPADQLDPNDLRLWLSVNGELRQDGRTSDMLFNCAQLIAKISGYMSLLPGDVITTGTPEGVGMGMSPPTFLRAGDVVRYGIEGIGEACQEVR